MVHARAFSGFACLVVLLTQGDRAWGGLAREVRSISISARPPARSVVRCRTCRYTILKVQSCWMSYAEVDQLKPLARKFAQVSYLSRLSVKVHKDLARSTDADAVALAGSCFCQDTRIASASGYARSRSTQVTCSAFGRCSSRYVFD